MSLVKAIAKALSVIQIVDPVLDIAAPIQIGCHEPLKGLPDSVENPLLCIGIPHGLHAKYIADGEAAWFLDIVVDKPSCVTLDEIANLREVSAQVAVLHGFRQMWGPQSIKRMLDDHEFGDIISIEGRYRQSSAADIACGPDPPLDKDWKSDLRAIRRSSTTSCFARLAKTHRPPPRSPKTLSSWRCS